MANPSEIMRWPSEEEIGAAGFTSELDYAIWKREQYLESLPPDERKAHLQREKEELLAIAGEGGGQ